MFDRYKSVVYLETDIGQPEYTPAGLVSLNYITNPSFGSILLF